MKFLLTNSKTIAETQEAFSELFPHLKIEFFTRPHEDKAASWSKYMIFDKTKTLQEVGLMKEGIITLSDDTKTGEFEQFPGVRYGLFVQVFRKSMSIWLETTKTDKWTLGEQEAKGKEWANSAVEMFYNERTNDDAMR